MSKLNNDKYWTSEGIITKEGKKELRRLLKQLDGDTKELKKFFGNDKFLYGLLGGITMIRQDFL